jgi:ATP-binding cassette, subfamily A (ABC1), member 3
MALIKQIWTLMVKNWRCNVLRHPTITLFMAVLVPLFFGAFLSFARNLFVPPAQFGIGSINDVRSLSSALEYGRNSGRGKIVLVDNDITGGDIGRVLDRLETAISDADPDMEVIRIQEEREISEHCRSSLRGVTTCFNAVVMRASPDEGDGGFWNYTIRTDAEFAGSPIRFDVEVTSNPSQIYMLPMQKAVDTIIARLDDEDADPLADTREYPYTDMTQEEREDWIRENYQQALVNFMGVTFIATIIWVTYHMTGFIATERESGMSTLIDAMMPVRFQWASQAARVVAHHLSFSIVYAPAWIVSSIIVRSGVFANTNAAILIILNLLGGLALCSFSILFASFFKRAQLSGITAILATLLLAILAQSITAPSTGIVIVLSVLFTPCSYVYFITLAARFEKQRRGAHLTDMPPDSPWELPGIALWAFMIVQIFAYPLIGFAIERYLYGTSSKGRVIQQPGASDSEEHAVKLSGFTKIYNPNIFSRIFSTKSNPAKPVVAVNELSFNARKGQIVALLGANGSGKSTTLDAIAGLNKLTRGSITIDGTGGLGIAPQKNVLWDDLTVEEHLYIFSRLKAPKTKTTPAEIRELIDAVDLTKKRKALSKTLSGGQKRKLQLGMMLIGGSAVCCVDEVSSGIDPLSRRKLWDILLAERGRRTMILTTHFLDEADLLADHIAILSKGTLRAEGSSVELKDRLGGGYKVHIQKTPDLKQTPIVDEVQKKETLDLVTYKSPSSSLSAKVIKQLETAGIHDYRYSGPTIEDVFLQVAEEIREEEAFRTATKAAELQEKGSLEDVSEDSGIKLMDGQRVGYVKQSMILFMKRLTILKRNWLPYLLAFLLPIIAAGLTSLFIQGQDPPGCAPGDQSSQSNTEDAFSQVDDGDMLTFIAGPPSKVPEVLFSRLVGPIFGGSGGGNDGGQGSFGNMIHVETWNDFQDTIERDRKNLTMGLWLGDDDAAPTFSWVANLFVTSPITAQQFLDMLLANTTIQTTWSPFDRPFNPQTGDSLNLVVYMGLALACYPAFFSLYPSNERRRFVRNLEYSNGVRPLPLWVAYLLFDFIIALVSSAILTGIWAAVSNIWFHIEFVFVVFMLYGLAAILMAYVVSLFTKSQLATYAWSAAIQLVCFLAYLIAYMCVNTYVPVAKIDDSLLIVHFVISAIAPIGSATRAIFLAVNLFSVACDGNAISDNPGGILQYGGPILYLIIQCLILFGALLYFDSGSAGSILRNIFNKNQDVAVDQDLSDEELANELNRVTSKGTHEDGLRVTHLTKTFKKNTAVDNVSFGIKRGEVFALLGPNGAGKSTTISLIRGDIKPSRNGGDVFVEDVSVIKNLADARANLGVCPQFDALDHMTVREHLEFYAKVRGIPDVQHNVTSVLQAVGLESFSTRMAHALSGGNKRKLSLGIALMGNPTVVLLDEPSSGLDAASKRIMWKTLASTVAGRSILLTTHSMEEADALAGRVGIMARRMLALGTPDNLRHRFGDALHIHLVSVNAPRTSQEEMDRVIAWIRTTFPTADVEEKTYHGQLRFSVHASEVLAVTQGRNQAEITSHNQDLSQSAIGNLVVLLEEKKAQLGIGHYSVSPTTLDQVFLTIVGQHNVKEEGYEETGKRPFWKKLLWKKS